MTTMETSKTIPETLADLRKLFARYDIEDWEPIPGDKDHSYGVRYRQAGQWVTISSLVQPTKAKNLRQCYQVIQYLFLWGARGVGGVSQGVTFIHGGLATTGNHQTEDVLAEAYATLGVEPTASMEEINSVFRTKSRFVHPDGVQDLDEKKVREQRSKRLNDAHDVIEKARA